MTTHQMRVKRGLRALLFGVFSLIAVACTGGEVASPDEPTTTAPEAASEETDPEEELERELVDVPEEPSAPVGLVVTANAAGSVTLEWDESRDETVTGYEVTRVASIGGSFTFETTDPIFTDAELNDGDVVTYTVAAVNDAGLSQRSEPVPVQVGVDTNPPSRPGTPRTVESTEGVSITWRASSDFSGIDTYIVTRILDGETTEIEATEPSLFDDIAVGQVVTYRVRAVDGAGNESDDSRNVTILSGTAADDVMVVVSTHADPVANPNTARLQQTLLDEGYIVTWFEDDVFDSNVTTSEDVVLLLGDAEGQGFDWNLFGTDANTIAFKSIFFEASGFVEGFPRSDRLAQLDYRPPGGDVREVALTNTVEPRATAFIPLLQQLPDLEVWGTPTWTDELAVAGLIRTGGELVTERDAPGCRAFFPGNVDSLDEQTNAGWDLMIEYINSVSDACR